MTRFDHETARWMPSRATEAGPSELSPIHERRCAVLDRSVRQAARWLRTGHSRLQNVQKALWGLGHFPGNRLGSNPVGWGLSKPASDASDFPAIHDGPGGDGSGGKPTREAHQTCWHPCGIPGTDQPKKECTILLGKVHSGGEKDHLKGLSAERTIAGKRPLYNGLSASLA